MEYEDELSKETKELVFNVTYILSHSQIFVEAGLAMLNDQMVIYAKPGFIFEDMDEDIVYIAEVPPEGSLNSADMVNNKSRDIIRGLMYEYLSGGRVLKEEVINESDRN